jgi:hypothetical protein
MLIAVGAALALTAALMLLGLLFELRVVRWPRFSLDAEDTPASAWSALLLFLAAAAAARSASGRATRARWWLAGLFAYMACDEAFAVHESLERVTGVDWQLLFLPVAAVAAAAFLRVLREIDRADVRWILLAAAGAWTVAQFCEKLEWHGAVRRPHYVALMLCEEALEMLGSLLFAVGFAELARAEAQRVRVARARARGSRTRPTSPPRASARPPRPTGRCG